jgi:ADP-ribosylglycohydrolase
MKLWKKRINWEDALKKTLSKYGFYHPIHTIPNAIVVSTALLWGGGEFEKSLTLGVMSGWDTDSNGATIGSICGVINGKKGIQKKWFRPLRNTVRTVIADFDKSRITDLSKRAADVAFKNIF